MSGSFGCLVAGGREGEESCGSQDNRVSFRQLATKVCSILAEVRSHYSVHVLELDQLFICRQRQVRRETTQWSWERGAVATFDNNLDRHRLSVVGRHCPFGSQISIRVGEFIAH